MARAAHVAAAVVAAPPDQVARFEEILAGESAALPLTVVAGGESRSDSVAAGVRAAASELVVVHDAARPLVTPELIDSILERLNGDSERACVLAAAPITDTVKEVEADVVVGTLDRSRLWGAQTPQAFRAEALREAIAEAGSLADATDDAMLVERVDGLVLIHPAPPENIKVTTPLDMRVAELLLAQRGAAG
jgi:2-C-methyl-D-erythritol 4-phosphate cytidylyltransferase